MFLLPTNDLEFIERSLGESSGKLRNKKVFLTGATGFIGKSLLETLLWLNKNKNLSLEIFSISRNPQAFFNSYPHFLEYPEFKLCAGDICDDFSGLDFGLIDLTIHAATDVVQKINPINLMKTCIDGTSNVIKFSKERGCQKFLLLSSGAVYGKQPFSIERLSESYIGGIDLITAQSAYSLGKQVSEWVLQQFKDEKMEIKVARCFAFVGPYLPLNQHFAIGNFIKSALLGRDIEIFGDGTPLRTYLYSSDLCHHLLKILLDASSGSVWNVGGSEVISIRELAEVVREELNPGIKINVHKTPGALSEKYIPDLTKITTELMVKPDVNLRLAIKKTADWSLSYADLN
jgi:nucleoside-diphosphate-sugar epimerase